MNFGKGGQNIVQSGNNNPNIFKGAGGFFGALLNQKLRIQERDYHRTKDEESRIRVNKAKDESGLRTRAIEKAIQGPLASMYYDHAFETLGEDHPDVLDPKKDAKADDYKRPEFAKAVFERGLTSGKHGVYPAQVPASISQIEGWKKYNEEKAAKLGSRKTDTNGNKVDTSAAIASSPVGGFNPKESDIQESLYANNNPNYFPFESTAGSSGNFSPTKFNNDEQPTFSETDADEIRANNKQTPFDTKEGYKERTAHLTDGINDGKGGNK